MAQTRETLIVREKHLEDIVESLKDMRNFALRTKDWPRKAEVERSLKLAQERLLRVAMKLSAMR